MANFETTRVLGQLLGYGIGKSNNVSKANVASVQGKLAGDQLHVTFSTIFTYDRNNPAFLNHQLKALKEESSSVVNEYVTQLKKGFKEASTGTLKLTEISSTDDMQMTSYNSMNTKVTAYFRLFVKYEIG
jgi:hypothetical protein